MLALSLTLGGCGGGGESNSGENQSPTSGSYKKGVVYDDVIQNLRYVTDHNSNYTNGNGEFLYENGKISFYVGNILIGTIDKVPSDGRVFLSDLYNLKRGVVDDERVIKTARFLQSLDTDKSSSKIVLDKESNKKEFKTFSTIESIDIETELSKVGKEVVDTNQAKNHMLGVFAKQGVSKLEISNEPLITKLHAPKKVYLNQKAQFRIEGVNFPDTLVMSLHGSKDCKMISKSSNDAVVICTPSVLGKIPLYVAEKSGGKAIATKVNLQTKVDKTEPNFSDSCYNKKFIDLTRGKDFYYCTRYAYGRACEVMGINLAFSADSGLDAGTWYKKVKNLPRGEEPRSNSIAVWSGGPYGHVAYVETVDGNNVIISEANWAIPFDGKYVKPHSLTKKAMSSRFDKIDKNGTLLGYIYLEKLPKIELPKKFDVEAGKDFTIEATVNDNDAFIGKEFTLVLQIGDGGGGFLPLNDKNKGVFSRIGDKYRYTLSVSKPKNNRQYKVILKVDGKEVVSEIGHYNALSSNVVPKPPKPINHSPVAQSKTYNTDQDRSVLIVLKATDEDGDSLTYKVGNPKHGKLVKRANNAYKYTPNAGFHGEDKFLFFAHDGKEQSAGKIITIIVKKVDSTTPTPNPTPTNHKPVAQSKTYYTEQDTPKTIVLNATDEDGDDITFQVGSPRDGTLVKKANNRYEYIPENGFHGEDKFLFFAHDGKEQSAGKIITIIVKKVDSTTPTPNPTPTNHKPVAQSKTYYTDQNTPKTIVLNATDEDGDDITFQVGSPRDGTLVKKANNRYEYIPENGFHGEDKFLFFAHDGKEQSAGKIITIIVKKVDSTTPTPTFTEPEIDYTYSVNPSSGDKGDYFKFKVRLSKELPSGYKVYAKFNDPSGGWFSDYEAGGKSEMSCSGTICSEEWRINEGTDRKVKFFIEKNGNMIGSYSSTEDFTVNEPVVTQTPPQIAYAIEVGPSSAQAGSTFLFRVKITKPLFDDYWVYAKFDDQNGGWLEDGQDAGMTPLDDCKPNNICYIRKVINGVGQRKVKYFIAKGNNRIGDFSQAESFRVTN